MLFFFGPWAVVNFEPQQYTIGKIFVEELINPNEIIMFNVFKFKL